MPAQSSPAQSPPAIPANPIHLSDYPIAHQLHGFNPGGPNQQDVRCPAHEDSRSSLSISLGKDGGLLLHCHAGCDKPSILRSLNAAWSDCFPPLGRRSRSGASNSPESSPAKNGKPKSRIVTTYDYRDELGILLYQVCRMDPKDFRFRRPDPEKPGRFVWNMKGVRRVLYRLPELIAAPIATPVLICEGEKDVHTAVSGGFVATTNSGGAETWQKDFNRFFKDRRVVIIPDNDSAGWKHLQKIVVQLAGIAESIKIVNLSKHFPNLPAKGGDLTDAKGLGLRPCDLTRIIEETAEYSPDSSDFVVSDDQREAGAAGESGGVSAIGKGKPPTPNEADDDPHRLAREFIRQKYTHPATNLPTLRFYRDAFYRFTGTHYIYLEHESELRAEITSFAKAELTAIHLRQLANPGLMHKPVAAKVNTALVGNILQAIRGEVLIQARDSSSGMQPFWIDVPEDHKQYFPDPDYNASHFITLKNGILPLSDFIADRDVNLIPHTPLYFSPICLPYDFDPSADCSIWRKFLARNLEGDHEREDLLQEWFGYNLIPDTSFQSFLLLEGEGSNGKSVICSVLNAIVGPGNCSAVNLEKFSDRFSLNETLGKLANIVADANELDKNSEGVLKAFVSGDIMQFDRKNRDPITARPTSRLTISCNNRPRFVDRSDAIFRRMIDFPMRVQIADEEKVRGMDKIAWWIAQPQELSGIFLWAAAGLHRLLKNQKFTASTVVESAREDYRNEMNPAREWILENLETDPHSTIPTQEIYNAYKKHCNEKGYHPMADRTFAKELNRAFKNQIKRHRVGPRGHQTFSYSGISWINLFDDNYLQANDSEKPDETLFGNFGA